MIIGSFNTTTKGMDTHHRKTFHTLINLTFLCINVFFYFSGPNDHIFVNFVDHGGPDLIAFPNEFVSLF